LPASTDVYLWRAAEKVGEPTDTEEVGKLQWVPISRIPELAQRQELLGAGALVPLLYYVATRGTGAAAPGENQPIEPA
jgi:hypothetical protein